MRLEPRELLLNLVAGWTPIRNGLRRFRDRRRPPDHGQIVDYTLERLRVRREFIGEERIRDATLLEIGSGPEFCLALLLLAIGARRIVSNEIEPYGFLRDEALYRLLVERASAEGIEIAWPPAGLIPDSNGTVHPDPERIVLYLGSSAASIPEPDESVDVTFSVAVLEHVRPLAMLPVARELHRLTRPGGVGYHRIDLVDHYYRHEEPFRFLRFTERQYELMYGNRGSSSNRMRIDEIEAVYREAGFGSVEFRDVRPYEDAVQFTRWAAEFDPEFQGRDLEMMRALECMLVLGR